MKYFRLARSCHRMFEHEVEVRNVGSLTLLHCMFEHDSCSLGRTTHAAAGRSPLSNQT